jgi:menaquinone-dependent protoporphyrinogen oxidase
VAEAIAATLRDYDLEVDIQPLKAVSSLAGYDAVVLGAPLFMCRWHKDARRFLSRHRPALEQRPAAVFALGPFNDVEEEWQGVRAQLDKALAKFPWFKPVAIEIFGGRFDPKLLTFPWNLVPGLKMMAPRDIRDWTAIRAWARNLGEKFQQDSVRLRLTFSQIHRQDERGRRQ